MSVEERFEDNLLDPLQEKRRRRINAVISLIKTEGEIEKRTLCGQLGVLYGIRRPTLEEYLIDLEDFGLIEVTGDTIRWIGEEPNEVEAP